MEKGARSSSATQKLQKRLKNRQAFENAGLFH